MQDRIPTPGQEGRVKITPEGGSPYYAKVEMADNPTQEGTLLSKANLLSDATALKLNGVATPNEALNLLGAALLKDGTAVKDALGNLITLPSAQLDERVRIATGSYTGTGTYGSGNPTTIPFPFDISILLISQITSSSAYTISPNMCLIEMDSFKLMTANGGAYFSVPLLRGGDTSNNCIFRASADVSNKSQISFFATSATSQLNFEGARINWVAIG